jgi:hypothetical protein
VRHTALCLRLAYPRFVTLYFKLGVSVGDGEKVAPQIGSDIREEDVFLAPPGAYVSGHYIFLPWQKLATLD